MFRSLPSRLWLSYVFLTGVILIVVGAALVLFLAQSNLVARVQLRAAAARLAIRQELPLNNKEQAQTVIQKLSEVIEMRVLLVDKDGNVAIDSQAGEASPISSIHPLPFDPLRDAFRVEDEEGAQWLFTGRPINPNYFLVAVTPRQPLREVLASPVSGELLEAILQAGAVALVLSLILAYMISRWVAGPLQKMAAAAGAVAQGQRTEVGLAGPEEVRALGEAFNEMTDRVHASQQSQRDFVANVSHELKTPLTSIQGFAQAILDGAASTPEARAKAAQVIYDESGRMHRLVLDLLDLARLDAGTADMARAPVNLTALLQAVVDKFTPQSRELKVNLIAEIEPLPAFIGDRDRLSQVFTNLVDNALKHTPPGGLVALRTRSEAGLVMITVKDSGEGIPPEELSRIFERFYQLDKSRKGGSGRGVGLGLAIAREIIQAHQGTLIASSQEGVGSTFTVTLPVAQPDDTTWVAPRAKR